MYLSGAPMNDSTTEVSGPAQHSTSSVPEHLSNATADCVVYFDGACPLCRREIAHYRSKEGSSAIEWVDAASCDTGALGGDLDRDAALAQLHARSSDGSLVSGVAAFAMIWSRLPAYRWLAPLVSRRPVLTVLEAGYAAFLRLRPLWRRANLH